MIFFPEWGVVGESKVDLGTDLGARLEKSIVIDIRLRYSLLFVHRMHWSLYFFE